MEDEVRDSIKRFETKQEFRQVRKLTSESFREDQEHLNLRLSKFQGKVARPDDDMADETEEERQPDDTTSSVCPSSVEVTIDKTDETGENGEMVNDNGETVNDNGETVNDNGETVNDNGEKVNDNGGNGELVSSKGEHVNGGFDGDEIDESYANLKITDRRSSSDNGHTDVNSNGVGNNSGKPVVNGSAKQQSHTLGPTGKTLSSESRGVSLLDLRKTGGRLYEKNEKLTPNSSHHWDKISLKGGRAHPHRNVEPPSERLAPIPPEAVVHHIPTDGDISSFKVDQMTSVFRMLKVEEGVVQYLRSKMVDGKQFSNLTDQNLEELRMKSPIVTYFRDRSSPSKKSQKPTPKGKFML